MREEPGADAVGGLLDDPARPKFIHAVNLVEVHYDLIRLVGVEQADREIADLTGSSLVVRRDMDAGFRGSVARLKSRGRISLADCFCIALANRLGGEVWTTDRTEFQPLADAGLCQAVFIR